MAGDWIKVECVTPDKPEVDAIADHLDVTVNEVVGGLIRLWIWADQQTVDGNAASVTKKAIDRHSGVSGFADALLLPSVGWLEACDSGGFRFPKFDRHNGQTAKTRALTSRRVAAHKAKKGNDASVTQALPREEKRREEVNKESSKEDSSVPTSGSAPEAADESTYVFPTMNGKSWRLPAQKLLEYRANYGQHLDVEHELVKAREWLVANSHRRKSPGGMPRFLTSWLNRASDDKTSRPKNGGGLPDDF